MGIKVSIGCPECGHECGYYLVEPVYGMKREWGEYVKEVVKNDNQERTCYKCGASFNNDKAGLKVG